MSEIRAADNPIETSTSEEPEAKIEEKKSEDVIVLDEFEEEEQPDIIDLVGQIAVGDRKCINYLCQSGVDLFSPPVFCLSFYRIRNVSNRNQKVCRQCYEIAVHHYDDLYVAFTEGKDIMEVDFPIRDETFAINDSDSEEEAEKEEDVHLDKDTMSLLEEHFDEVLGSAMAKAEYQDKVDEAVEYLKKKYESNNDSYLEVKTMIDSIRKEVDSMLLGLFGNLRPKNETLPELIVDEEKSFPTTLPRILLYPKAPTTVPAPIKTDDKIPLHSQIGLTKSEEAQSDVVTVQPPTDLPPRGQVYKPPLTIGEYYYAKRNSVLLSWVKVKLDNIFKAGSTLNSVETAHVTYQVVWENKQKVATKRHLTGRELAYSKPLEVLLEVGARVIALFKETDLKLTLKRDAYFPGVVGESPTKANNYRYLIFFDDGYSYYVGHNNVFLIYESSADVWEDVNEDSKPFIKKYITEYPNRSMVRLMKNQTVRTEYRGKWYVTTVLNVDCSLVQIFFDSQSRVEWIYRGSRRLNTMYKEEQAATSRLQHRQRTPRAVTTTMQSKAPYVQYTRDDPDVIFVPLEDEPKTEQQEQEQQEQLQQQQQRSVAKKSTRTMPPTPSQQVSHFTKPFLPVEKSEGKIVYYTPRKQSSGMKMYKQHTCGEVCQRDMHTPLQRLKGYGPLAKPLLVGFYRLQYKIKGKRSFIVYKTPCGRTVRNMEELHKYLRMTKSQLTVDLFNFDFWVRCLAEFILEPNNPVIKDLSGGQEEIQIPVVNYVNSEMNDFVNYSTKRMPMEGVYLNLDPEFLVGCNCTDDCIDKKKCSCWQLTLQGIKYLNKEEDEVGYNYRRLHEAIFTGIYECNSRCKCAKTCLNRVVQNPMQHKLQVFKTVNRGWGIRCINDIPQGSFICIYAGALLTDEMANAGGKSDGDEYLAELDYIEAVENSKEDYEEEAYESEEENTGRDDDEEEEEEERPEGRTRVSNVNKRRGFIPDSDFVPCVTTKFSDAGTNIRTRLRKRMSEPDEEPIRKVASKKTCTKKTKVMLEDDTVTISDDEDVREPSSFNPADDNLDRKVRKFTCVRKMFGDKENVYIMDAKNTGNIGRYLNHSCSPNIFVQNVFVDTHDLRFPWVSFFAKTYIRAGTELTWNYNYDIGSVENKFIMCRCGSTECKGRLL